MLVRVETSRVGPARLPSAASWRASSSFDFTVARPSPHAGRTCCNHSEKGAKEVVIGGSRISAGLIAAGFGGGRGWFRGDLQARRTFSRAFLGVSIFGSARIGSTERLGGGR